MIELPETYVLAEQINRTLIGKTIKTTITNAHPHSFAFYSGDHVAYGAMLENKPIVSANPNGGYTEILCGDMLLKISTPIKYHAKGEKLPKSHQLLLGLDDDTFVSCTVQMWGNMFCEPAANSTEGIVKPSPLEDAFDEAYWDEFLQSEKPNLSMKALLATEQRIPGLGNGVLHDILFNAKLHPKRKLETLSDNDKGGLFIAVKSTLKAMRDGGGRDTEKDLFNKGGGYQTILSANSWKRSGACSVCVGDLVKASYMGGAIYYCPTCQV
ncbi:MAG: endonuclease VIII [Defluviitaleaceae bacterium]|nr:endonuclease VIII [Defluviitaleaceae bacterium]